MSYLTIFKAIRFVKRSLKYFMKKNFGEAIFYIFVCKHKFLRRKIYGRQKQQREV